MKVIDVWMKKLVVSARKKRGAEVERKTSGN
jgi:hypothetical protein